MQIPGITSQDSSFFADSTAPPESQELDKDAFMQLLVTQLKNQDPLEPTANEEFIAQLANFSSLEQMELMNENLVGMVVLQQSNALLEQLTQGGALIGQSVSFTDPVVGNQDSGLVESVKVVDGQAVLRVDGQDVPLTYVNEVHGAPASDSDTTSDGASTSDEA